MKRLLTSAVSVATLLSIAAGPAFAYINIDEASSVRTSRRATVQRAEKNNNRSMITEKQRMRREQRMEENSRSKLSRAQSRMEKRRQGRAVDQKRIVPNPRSLRQWEPEAMKNVPASLVSTGRLKKAMRKPHISRRTLQQNVDEMRETVKAKALRRQPKKKMEMKKMQSTESTDSMEQ